MHLLLRCTLLRAAAHSARRSAGTACWHRVAWRSPARHEPRQRGSWDAGRSTGLHALGAALLEQQASSSSSSATAASLSGEVCSLRCCVFDVPGEIAEDVADVLCAYGAQSVSIEEFRPEGSPEQEIFVADNSAAEELWDRCTVIAYMPPELDAASILETVKGDCGLDHHRHAVEAVRAQDWEESIRVGLGLLGVAAAAGSSSGGGGFSSVAGFAAWHSVQSLAANRAAWEQYKESYQPTQVEPGLWIVPVWSQPPEPKSTNIILEPGLAFGTGDHPTTRLCLRWLRRLKLTGQSVMDYGTGSGVLAIAALLMGAERAVGTDVEPLSIKAAAANAEHNGVAACLAPYLCSASVEAGEPLEEAGVAQQARQFDVVVANILQGPLLSLAPRLASYAKPGALLGLSGILLEQAPAVIEAYTPYFEGFEVAGEDQWALVTARRKAGAA